MRSPAEFRLTMVVSDEQLALLKKVDFPCSQGVLASVRSGDEGTELTGVSPGRPITFAGAARASCFTRSQRRGAATRRDDLGDDGASVAPSTTPAALGPARHSPTAPVCFSGTQLIRPTPYPPYALLRRGFQPRDRPRLWRLARPGWRDTATVRGGGARALRRRGSAAPRGPRSSSGRRASVGTARSP
jgi:hypothetical protein